MAHDAPIPSIATHWGRHTGAAIFVCGFGGSLYRFDWSRLHGRIVIAINDAIAKIPWATYHLYGDGRLYKNYWHIPYGPDTTIVIQPRGTHRIMTAYAWPHRPKVRMFARIEGTDFQWIRPESDELWVNTTIATAAIMMAWKLGAATVFLLGVDGYLDPDGPYYADGNPSQGGWGEFTAAPSGVVIQDRHRAWAQDMRDLRDYFSAQEMKGYRVPDVINLNPRSTIDAWSKKPREEVLS